MAEGSVEGWVVDLAADSAAAPMVVVGVSSATLALEVTKVAVEVRMATEGLAARRADIRAAAALSEDWVDYQRLSTVPCTDEALH